MEALKDLRHRLGVAEIAVVRLQEETKAVADHEQRIRKLESLTAKVAGAAIIGSSLGSLLLTKLTGCI